MKRDDIVREALLARDAEIIKSAEYEIALDQIKQLALEAVLQPHAVAEKIGQIIKLASWRDRSKSDDGS